MSELLCPNCRQPLVLPEETAKFDFIFMSRVECQECGASVIIEDNVPRLPRDGEPLGRPTRRLDSAKILELRKQGLTWREIAEEMGAGVGTAFRAAKGLGIRHPVVPAVSERIP